MVLLFLTLLPPAQAHLMVAQRGTLNLVGDGAFMVLSLPVSAFTGIDDDNDGVLSAAELRRHGDDIEAQIQHGVQLTDTTGARPLQGLMLQLSAPNHDGTTASAQIVVLGRFALGAQRTGLRLRMTLFGRGADERSQQLTVSRGSEAQRLVLAPGHEAGEVFPSAWTTVVDHAQQGMAHVLAGPDHLLFLLVVLASGWGLRKVLLSLTCFTLGHGVTLAGSALGAWSRAVCRRGARDRGHYRGHGLAGPMVQAQGTARWHAGFRATAADPGFRLRADPWFGSGGCAGKSRARHRPSLVELAGIQPGYRDGAGRRGKSGAVLLLLAATRLPAIQANAVRFASVAAVALGSVWLVQRLAALA